MQMDLLSQERSCTSVASFWKWVFLELGNGLFYCHGQLKLLSHLVQKRYSCFERYCGWFWDHCSSQKFWKNDTRGHGLCFRVLKRSSKSRLDSYSVRNSVLTISHITFRDCRVRFFSDNLSRKSCILYSKKLTGTTETKSWNWWPLWSRIGSENCKGTASVHFNPFV